MEKLYSVSYRTTVEGYNGVLVAFGASRERPIAPYAVLIKDYDALIAKDLEADAYVDEENAAWGDRMFVDELFTEVEVQALKEHFQPNEGEEWTVEEHPLPIRTRVGNGYRETRLEGLAAQEHFNPGFLLTTEGKEDLEVPGVGKVRAYGLVGTSPRHIAEARAALVRAARQRRLEKAAAEVDRQRAKDVLALVQKGEILLPGPMLEMLERCADGIPFASPRHTDYGLEEIPF